MTTPYDRAISRAMALAEAVLQRPYSAPRRLACDCGAPPSSGYRAIATMEAAGVLSRDLSGRFLRGPGAIRIGLSAWGFGQLASVALPVLDHLRRDTGRTALIGLAREEDLAIGPFSLGRGAEYVLPVAEVYHVHWLEPRGELEVAALQSEGHVSDLAVARFALVHRVGERREDANAYVGILVRKFTAEEAERFSSAVTQAADRLVGAGA